MHPDSSRLSLKSIGVVLLAIVVSSCQLRAQKESKLPALCSTTVLTVSQLFKLASPSVVVIKSKNTQGSGFVVNRDDRYTYVLTNSHVVDGSRSVAVKWTDGREEKAEVIADYGGYPAQKDLALIKIDGIRGEPLKLKPSKPEIGIDTVVIGSPKGLEFSLSRGVLSQIREQGDFLQTDAPVNPGNSGGPLLDSTGCVIGVVTMKLDKSEGLNFAVGYGPVNHFLKNPSFEEPLERPDAYKPLLSGWHRIGEYSHYVKGKLSNSSNHEVDLGSFVLSGPWVNFKYRTWTKWSGRLADVLGDVEEERRNDIRRLGVDCANQVLRFYPHQSPGEKRIGLEDYTYVGDEWWSRRELRQGYSEGNKASLYSWDLIFDSVCKIAAAQDARKVPTKYFERRN